MDKKSLIKKIAAAIILSAGFIALVAAASRSSQPKDARWQSWQSFCESRGYDPIESGDAARINEYLDAWRGSAAEEEALANAGCETF